MEKNYEKMKTTELLDLQPEDIPDTELDKRDEALQSRDPFEYYSEQLSELRDKVERLERDLRRHDHKDGCVVVNL